MACLATRLVAVCGRKSSGKDCVARRLSEAHGYVHLKLAAPLKAATAALFGVAPEDLEDEAAKERAVAELGGATPRQLMQALGTEVRESVCRALGVPRDLFARRLWLEARHHARVVVSDLRFPHEHEFLRRACPDLVVVRLERPGPASWDPHASERAFESVPASIVLANDASPAHLDAAVDLLVARGEM